jgi:malonyl-CoA decarboxylase
MATGTPQRSWLDRLWAGIADQGRAFTRAPSGEVTGVARAHALAAALLSERGEASGAALSRELTICLRALPAADRLSVLRAISEGFAPDPAALRTAADAYLANPSAEAAARLHAAAEPPRQELLRRMNMAPGGTAMLVALRHEMLAHLKADPTLRPLDHDLLHLFASWFNRGFLELRRIDWQTPAAILEKLITYEAVHEIDGWPDLRRRLLPDRRCFAFFHQALKDEPLIFVEVALTAGLADAVQPLLARPENEAACASKDADTAIFYSISNCQEGLRGVSFGNFLIKQVVEELKAELPRLKQFATLSPVPGFATWLRAQTHAGTAPFTPEELDLAEATQGHWWDDPTRAAQLRAPLLRAAAIYLTRDAAPDTKIDPVARFHLGNGARLERINWLGNTSTRGMRESYGIMVNYLYDPGSIEANHEAFVNTGHVARSAAVDALATTRRAKQAASKAA